jgi:hypothetical protein
MWLKIFIQELFLRDFFNGNPLRTLFINEFAERFKSLSSIIIKAVYKRPIDIFRPTIFIKKFFKLYDDKDIIGIYVIITKSIHAYQYD